VRSAFAVVTDDCHANSISVTHIAVNGEWCQASRAIWINFVVSTNIADEFPDHRTGSVIDRSVFKAISLVTMVTLA